MTSVGRPRRWQGEVLNETTDPAPRAEAGPAARDEAWTANAPLDEWTERESRWAQEKYELERLAEVRSAEIKRLVAAARQRIAEWTEREATSATDRSALERLANERAEEIKRLRAHIDAIHASTTWRMGGPIRALRRAFARVRMLLGKGIVLVPMHQVEKVARHGPFTEWQMVGDDPQFALSPLKASELTAGHYRLTLSIQGDGETLRSPVVYIDRGSDFVEADCVALSLAMRSASRAVAHLALHTDAKALRFDPSIAPGKITLGPARLRRMFRWEHYLRLAVALTRRRIRSYGDLKRYAGRAIADPEGRRPAPAGRDVAASHAGGRGQLRQLDQGP